MKEKLTKLLNTLYEAEGLVEMALRRKVEANDRLVELIADKCFEIASQGSIIEQSIDKSQIDDDGTLTPPIYNETAADETPVTSEAPVTHEDAIATENQDIIETSEEEKVVDVFTNEILPQISAEKDNIHDASIFDNEPELPLENDVTDTDEEDADDEPEYDDDEDEEDYYEPDPVPLASNESAARTSLMSFCSINDKFRFKRELFGNSEHQMRYTFSLIEKMDSADTVRLYCNADLKWDNNARIVKDFFNVIDRYFKEESEN